MSGVPLGSTDPNYAAWAHEPVVRYFGHARMTPEALYESERAVLMPALTRCASVLDVGCAAGGLSQVLQTLKPGIRYVGVDVVPEMVNEARRRYPLATFEVSDGSTLRFADGSFDLVVCLGVLHHNPAYRELIRELYRVTGRGCVLDLPRLVRAPYTFDPAASHMVLADQFGVGGLSGERQPTAVPYVLANPQSLFGFLLEELRPRPAALAAVGYYGKPSEAAVLPVRPVCFCVAYLGKGTVQSQRTRLLIDLPGDVAASVRWRQAEVIATDRSRLGALIGASA